MKNARIIALSLGLLITGSAAGPISATESATLPVEAVRLAGTIWTARADPAIHSDSPELDGLVAWAVGRYSQAGLELPDLDVYFSDDSEACKGHAALHTRQESGSRIDVCSVTRTRKVEKDMLHELAHAWAAHTLTDDRRQGFVELRGLDVWYDREVDWNERGTEQAAEILAWGLGETSRRPMWMPDNGLDSLSAAFRLLTGTEPITDTSREWQEGRETSPGSDSRSTHSGGERVTAEVGRTTAGPERLSQ